MATRRVKAARPHPLPLVQQLIESCEGIHERNLCDHAGVARGYISQLRMGANNNPKLMQFGCLAEALGYELVLKEKSNGEGNS